MPILRYSANASDIVWEMNNVGSTSLRKSWSNSKLKSIIQMKLHYISMRISFVDSSNSKIYEDRWTKLWLDALRTWRVERVFWDELIKHLRPTQPHAIPPPEMQSVNMEIAHRNRNDDLASISVTHNLLPTISRFHCLLIKRSVCCHGFPQKRCNM